MTIMYSASIIQKRVLSRYYTHISNSVIHRAIPRLIEGILKSDRATLAESITLVESSNQKRREIAHQLLSELSIKTKNNRNSTFRIGLTILIR